MRLVPGWKRIVLIAAPITTAAALLVAAYAYTASGLPGPTAPVAAPALEIPPQPAHLLTSAAPSKNPARTARPRGVPSSTPTRPPAGFAPDPASSRRPNPPARLAEGGRLKAPS